MTDTRADGVFSGTLPVQQTTATTSGRSSRLSTNKPAGGGQTQLAGFTTLQPRSLLAKTVGNVCPVPEHCAFTVVKQPQRHQLPSFVCFAWILHRLPILWDSGR